MAATLAETPLRNLEAALPRLRPGSVAYRLVLDEIEATYEHQAEVHAEDGYIRHLEHRGYDEARLQEQMEAQLGIPA
jgi:hypothetical protein